MDYDDGKKAALNISPGKKAWLQTLAESSGFDNVPGHAKYILSRFGASEHFINGWIDGWNEEA